MIEYQITGSTRNKKRFDRFVQDVILELLPYPYKRLVEIDIEIVNTLIHGNYAECDGDRNAANVVLSRRDENNELFSERYMALNVAHELVHAKQFIKGQLSYKMNGNAWCDFWMKKPVTARRPWEKEAYKLEEELVAKYW
jgi:hypothetical protein|tara:strand:+ start:824 stop:1243 length:420 start_codon:yes stop_codon:yes gene_type:complete